jgi:hypothetical protein
MQARYECDQQQRVPQTNRDEHKQDITGPWDPYEMSAKYIVYVHQPSRIIDMGWATRKWQLECY